MEDHWHMVTRDGVAPLDFNKAVADMAWLISSSTSPPYEWDRGRVEDGCGNEVFGPQIAEVLNHVPALLVRIRELEAKLVD